MWSGNSPGATNFRDHFTTRNLLAFAHEVQLVMRVNGNKASGMTDDYNVAIAA